MVDTVLYLVTTYQPTPKGYDATVGTLLDKIRPEMSAKRLSNRTTNQD
jgi:hypothetical protein